jgi:hypothetical protein
MNLDSILGQARPFLQLAATVLIVIALVKFAGFSVPLRAAWWELGLAGWLTKQI